METFWYVVKVFPGKERKLNDQLNQQINLGRIKNIRRFVCPTESELITQRNKKVIREKVIYSGYLYFESGKKLNEDELKDVSSKQNVMGMMGDRMPILMKNDDVKKIIKDDLLNEHKESKRLKFIKGDSVVITEGPFSSFEGTISQLDDEKVDVDVLIFGRSTKVTLSINQIEKRF